ncbi:unnamed protein product, partial [Mesorhabditis spiculigera]
MTALKSAILLLLASSAVVAEEARALQDRDDPAWIDCTLVQTVPGRPDFSIDIRTDPIVAYKGSPLASTDIFFHIYIDGDNIVREYYTVDPCKMGDLHKCIKFYMISLHVDLSRQMQDAKRRSVRIAFNFKETSAFVKFIRTKMCGEFIYNQDPGEWVANDRAYINANVVMAGSAEMPTRQSRMLPYQGTEKKPREQQQLHSNLHRVYPDASRLNHTITSHGK